MLSKLLGTIAVLGAAAVLAVNASAISDSSWDSYSDDYYDTRRWDEYYCDGFRYVDNGDMTATVIGYEDRSVSRLEIPSQLNGRKVTDIGSGSFTWFTQLRTVVIPDSVTGIGSSAFHGCEALEEINLPEKLREIPLYCFYGCTSLKHIEIPNGVTEIGGLAFSDCYALEELRIPSSVTSIGYGAFSGCENLTVYCRRGSEAARYFDEIIGKKFGIKCVEEVPPAGETALAIGIAVGAWTVIIVVVAVCFIAAKKREK